MNLPINVFGSTSGNNENKIDTSIFVQKPYLRTNYIESNIEEDLDMKNQFKIKNIPCPQENSDAVCKSYVDSELNDPSLIRKSAHVDFNDKNLDNVRFVKVNSLPAVREHLTPKLYVDEAISHSVDESSLIRLDPDEKSELDEKDSIILNSTLISPKTIIEIPTKLFINSSHENSRNTRDLSSVFNDQDNEFDNS